LSHSSTHSNGTRRRA